MKQSDSFQIQGEYVTSVGPHNGRGKRGGPGKIKSTTGGHAPLKGSFAFSPGTLLTAGVKDWNMSTEREKDQFLFLFNGLFH